MSYKTIGIGNTTQHNIGNVSSGSFSHTVVSGSDRKLILVHCGRDGAISSVTANGSSMTLAKQSTSFDGCYTQIWYLDNPDVGSNTISYTLSSLENDRAVIGVIDITNAKQKTITRTDEQVGNASGFTNSITVDVSGSIVIEGQFNTGQVSGLVNGGQSYIAVRSGNDSGGVSYKANVSAGGNSVGWNSFEQSDTAFSEAVVVIEPAKQKGGAFIYNLI